MLAQQVGSSEDLQGRNVTGGGQYHVWFASPVGAGPLPYAEASGAVHDRLSHGQILQGGLLAGHDDIHIVPGAQAVVCDRQQAVGVGRKIDPNGVGLLVDGMVDEAWVLMG